MRLPDVVGCGAGKSGTTSLYYYLSEHPDIFMAPAKEIHFFSKHFKEGLEWYQKQFTGYSGENIIGEFSTSYLMDKLVPERLHICLPNAKLLFIFRNPVDRAFSNFLFSQSLGFQDLGSSFSEVIRTKEGFNEYIDPGFYYDHLQVYLEYYNLSRIHVMFTENLKANPLLVMQRCYDFLGVDSSYQPDINSIFNKTVISSNKFRNNIDKKWLSIKNAIKPRFLWLPKNLRRHFSNAEQRFRGFLLSDEKPEMSDDDSLYLSNLYSEKNQQLAELLDRDLPWN